MPIRPRLLDYRASRGPATVGICQANIAECAAIVNSAQQRLILAKQSGDEGWWGSWARMVFNVNQTDPYITTPREVARLEQMTVCNRPVRIQNEFFEFLDFGIGLQPKNRFCNFLETYERGVYPSFSDLVPPNKLIRVYITDAADVGKRALIQGKDQNDTTIYSQDGLVQVTGTFVDFVSPFVDTAMVLNTLNGIQKDITSGQVKFFEVDSVTGVERLILIMEPGETVAAYRRYLVNGLPNSCACSCTNPTQVTAMAKLDFIPVAVDTDYLTIQNVEAIIEECQSVRYSTMDQPAAAQLAIKHHRDAIALLNGQLIHMLGKQRPAISFKPFGSAALERQAIGTMI